MSGTSSRRMELLNPTQGHPKSKPIHDASVKRLGVPTYHEHNPKHFKGRSVLRNIQTINWSRRGPTDLPHPIEKRTRKALVTNNRVDILPNRQERGWTRQLNSPKRDRLVHNWCIRWQRATPPLPKRNKDPSPTQVYSESPPPCAGTRERHVLSALPSQRRPPGGWTKHKFCRYLKRLGTVVDMPLDPTDVNQVQVSTSSHWKEVRP